MMKFLRFGAEIGNPRGRVGACLLAWFLLLWTAGAQALSPPAGTPIENTAAAQYGDAGGNPLSAISNTVSISLSGAPLLRLEKTADSHPVAAGSLLTYTLRYENTGNSAATGVTIADTLPVDVVFQSASSGGVYDAASRRVTWTIGTLASGAGGLLSVTVRAQEGLAEGTSLFNTAVITSDQGMTAAASVTTAVGSASNLVLEKSGAGSTVAPGGTILYTLSYRNIGNLAARAVRITDDIPAGTSYVAGSATAPGMLSGGSLTWDLGDVAPGARGELSFAVRVSAGASPGQQISNQASIVSQTEAKLSNTVVTTVSTQSLMLLKMDSPDPVRAGNHLTYALRLENAGAAPLTGVVLSDPLPVGTTFVSADGAYTLEAGGREVVWNIGTLAPGEARTLSLTVQVNADVRQGQVIENTITATSHEMPPQTARAVSGVISRTPGEVALFDSSWQKVIGYAGGETVYIEVADADRNADPAAAETVTVVLVNSATGDTETVTLAETGPDTGVFRGSIATSLSASSAADGVLSVAVNSRIVATYTDPLDAEPAHAAAALIDPMGVVFDSVTGAPVAGAVVTLRYWVASTSSCDLTSWPTLPPGQVNPAPPTGADGRFEFPLVSPGDYCFEVTPPAGYAFPTALTDADLPPGYHIGPASRGLGFTLNAGDPPLVADLPVDPTAAGKLFVSKTVNKTTAALGEILLYTVKLENSGDAPVTNLAVTDIMPHGIAYVEKSTSINGTAAADPRTGPARTLLWSVASLPAGGSISISYRAVVGPDAKSGDGVNSVTASGSCLGGVVRSNRAAAKVKIEEGVFTSKGTIIGRVYLDAGGGPRKDKGVPDVALYLEDGTRVITDRQGKFSIAGVVPGTHVLRLDETTLPKDLAVKRIPGRTMKSGASQFVEMTYGGLVKVNFVCEEIKRPAENAAPEKIPDARVAPATEERIATPSPDAQQAVSAGRMYFAPMAEDAEDDVAAEPKHVAGVTPKRQGAGADVSGVPSAPAQIPSSEASSPEERIKTMTPELAILSPRDGEISDRPGIRVMVKFPLGQNLTLLVNGAPVDESRIGTRMQYEKGGVALYEFVDVRLKPAQDNILTARAYDQFNIVRGEKQIRVAAVGAPAKITLSPDRTRAEADGQSKISVEVALQDNRGWTAPCSGPITVDASLGEISETDADPANDGHQILCKDGRARFTVVAPRETGEANISAEYNGLSASADISFVPHQRPMFVVGVGEIVLGHGSSSGDLSYLKDRSFFGDGTYLDGRGAFFMKGRLFKDVVLTAAYDSNKKRADELFRESDTRLDAEDKYPIYGDESKTGYEALSRENLYLKLEKGRSYLLLGDYRTDLNQTTLGAYARSFNGVKIEADLGQFQLKGFGAHTDQVQLVDVLPGKGISGLYYLNSHDLVDGSERVVIEVRDRLQPDSVLKREVKSRGADYEVDYGLGAILFKEAVPSHDAGGNPVYIVATYESRQAGDKYYVYGGRAAYQITGNAQVGATVVVEENAVKNNYLAGGDVKLNLPGNTTIKAEYVRTRGLFEESSMLVSQEGEGWSLTAESKPLAGLSLKGYWRDLSDYFNNPSASDAVRGTRKYGLEALYQAAPTLELKARYLNQDDRINDSKHLLASFGATKKFDRTTVSAELSHEEGDNLTNTPAQIPATPAGLLNGVPFFNAYETPERATFLRLALERELLKNLSLLLSHKHDVGRGGYFISEGGLNYKLNNQSRLYLREEYAKFEEGAQNRTLLGVESQVLRDTTAFYEYRLANGADGSRNQQVMGLKNKWRILDGLTANVAAEYLSTISGQKNENEPDAYAAALALEYLRQDNVKVTGRLEHRNEIGGDKSSYLAEVSTAYKLHPDYSLLLRERYFLEETGSGDNHTSRLLVGLAYRPLDNDRFNALGRVEYKYNRQPSAAPGYTTNAFILSTEGVYQLTPALQLTGKYAGKLEMDDEFSSYTDLVAGRFLYDLSDNLDVSAEYRLLTAHLTQARMHGGFVEVGYRIVEQMWLSLGYCFDRFDEDLTGESYRGEGPYLKLRFKFDENFFRPGR